MSEVFYVETTCRIANHQAGTVSKAIRDPSSPWNFVILLDFPVYGKYKKQRQASYLEVDRISRSTYYRRR